MKYPKIIAELERTQWAITPEALDGIRKAVEIGLSSEDYELFHKVEINILEDNEIEPMIVEGRGILTLNGPIIPRANSFSKASGIVSIDKLTADFKAFEADESVKEIQFLVDSPGGAVTGVSDFSQLVKASEKKTSAFIVGQAASAAYWIISAVDYIVSSNTGQPGSLGVVLSYRKNDDGTQEIISAQTPNKRSNPDTKEGKVVLQQLVNDLADVFIEAVAMNRNVDIETVLEDFGKGSLIPARRALEVGMIDEISTIHDFMSEAKEHGDESLLEAQVQQRRGRSEIQTLIFKKSNFPTKQSAQKWARDHDFKSSPVVEKEETWHIRQENPDKYQTFRTGKPLAPGVTPVFGILRRQRAEQTQPAIAGERTAAMMTLAEFLAENPAARAEVEAFKTEAFEAGRATLRLEIIRIATLMECKDYSDKFREKALLALKGERTLEAIEILADYLDVQIEENSSQLAQEESAELPETPPIGERPSANGEIANPLDIQAYWDLFKANRSESEVQ